MKTEDAVFFVPHGGGMMLDLLTGEGVRPFDSYGWFDVSWDFLHDYYTSHLKGRNSHDDIQCYPITNSQ